MKFVKFLGTPFLKNTSSGCFIVSSSRHSVYNSSSVESPLVVTIVLFEIRYIIKPLIANVRVIWNMMRREEYNISHTVLSVSIKNKKKQHLISKAGKNRNIFIKEDYAFEVFSYKISNN